MMAAKGWGLGEIGEEGKRVETSSYKLNNSWRCNVQGGDYS